MGIAPEPLGDPEGVCWGVFFGREPLDPRLNIPICYDLITHSSLLDEQNVKEHVVTCDVGLTCDIIDESFYKPIIVAPANPSCSTPTSSSSSSDGFSCDASLMVENETLKEVNELTRALGKAYGGEDRLLMGF